MGNFGNSLPQVDRIQMPQRNTGQLAQAMGNLGQAVGQVAKQQAEQKKAEQDKKDKADFALQSSK